MTKREAAQALVFMATMACGVLTESAARAVDEDPADPAYGSGHHGTWIQDEFGLPAYFYTGCTGAEAPCIDGADAVHQLGNDGVNALAHGGGYVELYSARSYHRFANRYDEASRSYAGGFGWVRDGRETWSTLWADRPAGSRYERTFGMGYVKKVIAYRGLLLEDYVYLTEGEDAVLRERLVFTNESAARKAITYFDYWDVAWWHPRIVPGQPSASSYDAATVKTSYDPRLGVVSAVSQAKAGDPDRPDFWTDPVPQASFVAYAAGAPDAFETVQSAFLGDGSRQLPGSVARGALANGVDATGALPNPDAVLVTQKGFTLAPGERRVVDLAFGLAPRDEEAGRDPPPPRRARLHVAADRGALGPFHAQGAARVERVARTGACLELLLSPLRRAPRRLLRREGPQSRKHLSLRLGHELRPALDVSSPPAARVHGPGARQGEPSLLPASHEAER